MILQKINPFLILLSISLFLISGCGSSGGNGGGGGLGVADPADGLFAPVGESNPPFIEYSIPPDQNERTTSPFGLVLVHEHLGLIHEERIWFSSDIVDSEFPPDKIGVFDIQNEIFPMICETNQDLCPHVIPGALNLSGNDEQLSNGQGPPPENQDPPVSVSSQPRGIVFDPLEGDLWFSLYGTSVIGKTNIENQNVFEYPLPTQGSGPMDIAMDPKGKIWFTENLASQIGRLDPNLVQAGTPDGITEYPVCAGPFGIDIDVNQGDIWFACSISNEIGVLRSQNDFNLELFQIPTPLSSPMGIIVAQNNLIWFAESDGNKIGRLDPTAEKDSQFLEYILPDGGSLPHDPHDLAIDPETNKIWFTEFLGNRIGSLDPMLANPDTSDGFTEYDIPTPNSGPTAILIDSEGSIWFSETAAQKIGKLTPP